MLIKKKYVIITSKFNNTNIFLYFTSINFYSQITIQNMCINKITFFNSYNNLNSLPQVDKEIAIIGNSNVGKSSFLNFFSNNKKLCFVSKNPGRTKNFNYFKYKKGVYFVDLPGYGYSKTSKIMNFKFNKLIYKYIKKRKSLTGLFLIMDVRYPLKFNDINVIEFAHFNNKKLHILLNKSDKISKHTGNSILEKTCSFMKKHSINSSIQLYSIKHRQDKKKLFPILNNWI